MGDTVHRKKALASQASRGLNDSIKCENCGGRKNFVVDSRPNKSGRLIRRRRECVQCAERFSTIEVKSSSFDEIPEIILNLILDTMSREIKENVSKSLKEVLCSETWDLKRENNKGKNDERN
jgi:hypothetical protein